MSMRRSLYCPTKFLCVSSFLYAITQITSKSKTSGSDFVHWGFVRLGFVRWDFVHWDFVRWDFVLAPYRYIDIDIYIYIPVKNSYISYADFLIGQHYIMWHVVYLQFTQIKHLINCVSNYSRHFELVSLIAHVMPDPFNL